MRVKFLAIHVNNQATACRLPPAVSKNLNLLLLTPERVTPYDMAGTGPFLRTQRQ